MILEIKGLKKYKYKNKYLSLDVNYAKIAGNHINSFELDNSHKWL